MLTIDHFLPLREVLKLLEVFILWLLFASRQKRNNSMRKSSDKHLIYLIQLRHPHLNSHIVGPRNKLRFETEGTQKIPLRVVSNPTQNDQ
jgi:hypothetical protein